LIIREKSGVIEKEPTPHKENQKHEENKGISGVKSHSTPYSLFASFIRPPDLFLHDIEDQSALRLPGLKAGASSGLTSHFDRLSVLSLPKEVASASPS